MNFSIDTVGREHSFFSIDPPFIFIKPVQTPTPEQTSEPISEAIEEATDSLQDLSDSVAALFDQFRTSPSLDTRTPSPAPLHQAEKIASPSTPTPHHVLSPSPTDFTHTSPLSFSSSEASPRGNSPEFKQREPSTPFARAFASPTPALHQVIHGPDHTMPAFPFAPAVNSPKFISQDVCEAIQLWEEIIAPFKNAWLTFCSRIGADAKVEAPFFAEKNQRYLWEYYTDFHKRVQKGKNLSEMAFYHPRNFAPGLADNAMKFPIYIALYNGSNARCAPDFNLQMFSA
jgi:hypothetical protein